MKTKLLAIVLLYVTAITFSGCKKEMIAAFTASTSSPYTGDQVNFTSTTKATGGFLEKGTPTVFTWNFGDGATGSGSSTSHSYSSAGSYVVTLTVEDNDGDRKGQISQTVTVSIPYGDAIFWENSGGTNIAVNVFVGANTYTDYINGSFYYTNAPACGSNYCANFHLPEGTYTFHAASSFNTWDNSIVVTRNSCSPMLLQ